MEIREHFVKFDVYCPKCEHFKSSDAEDPCDICLSNTVNEDSRVPTHYKGEKPQGVY